MGGTSESSCHVVLLPDEKATCNENAHTQSNSRVGISSFTLLLK